MLRSVVRTIAAGSVVAAIFACGGSSDGGTTGPTPVFTSVSVTPASPTVSVGGTTTLTATAKDQNGANFGGGTGATWSSSNTAAATVNSTTGVVSGVANGSSTISASITIGSITNSGSQMISVSTPSATGDITATTGLAFDPNKVTVARAGGTASVTWHFQSTAHTVTWDATAGSEADIPATMSADVSRNFTVAGTYHFHCSIHPQMTGVITVQ
jgi:trimeric autotransporter adhesin